MIKFAACYPGAVATTFGPIFRRMRSKWLDEDGSTPRSNLSTDNMKKRGFWYKVYDLYYDGFRNMTLGKTLWAVIIIKLIIIFVVLKIFFFPNHIKQHAEEGDEPSYVWQQIKDSS